MTLATRVLQQSFSSRRGLAWAGACWVLLLAAAILAFELPRPLFFNLGPGDEECARGFRGRWERDGLNQSGETTFRWTQDGARLNLPVTVGGGRLEARLRLARFAETPADITVLAAGRSVDAWTQAPSGWQQRRVDLGELRGALVLQFRSTSTADDELGVALDWVEVTGATRVAPLSSLLPGLVALFLGVPLVLLIARCERATILVAWLGLPVLAAISLGLDRLGGLLALAAAGPPALVATLLLVLGFKGFTRAWPDLVPATGGVLAIPLASVLVACVAFSHPFYYYPDLDTHLRLLDALRGNPWLLFDPTQAWARRGDWTREIGGQALAIPYSVVFHALAWPLVKPLGALSALKTIAVVCVGFTLLLVHALARALGLGRAALVAQAIVPLLPVTTSRLGLVLYPTLLGQATVVLVFVVLARRLPALEGAHATLFVALVLAAAQVAYTGSLLVLGITVAELVCLELALGDRRRALLLLAAHAMATAAVLGTMYARFLPVLVDRVLPHLSEGSGAARRATGPGELLGMAATRLGIFYDLVYPLLLLPGLAWLRRTAAPPARRLVVAALAAGATMALLRYVIPALLRDVKEVEMLAAPVACVAAAGMCWLRSRGRWGPWAAAAAALVAASWGAGRSLGLYAEWFFAKGR